VQGIAIAITITETRLTEVIVSGELKGNDCQLPDSVVFIKDQAFYSFRFE
jgi:hypothetical protein